MTTEPIPYDATAFTIDRTRGDVMSTVQVASFSVNSGYTEDALGTLILESDAAQASISFWQDVPDPLPLRAGDGVVAWYGGRVVFRGTVTDVRITYTTDPAGALPRGHTRRAVLSASLAGDFATSLFPISLYARPAQGAYQRLNLMATMMSDAGVDGAGLSWDGAGGFDPGTQTQAAPTQALGDGRYVTVLDVIRQASVAMTEPVRFSAPGRIEILTEDNAGLPSGLDADDGDNLYTEAVVATTAGARSIALVGQGPDGGTSATLLGDAVGPGTDYSPGFPLGLGHLVNLAHVVQMPPGPEVLMPVSAKLKRDDVRILLSGWKVPDRLPVIGGPPMPVKRVNYEFTPDSFSASIEYASRDLSPKPHAAWTGDKPGVDRFGNFVIPSLPPTGPTGRILVVATPDYLTVGDVPSFGHQIPDTSYAYRWYPREIHTDYEAGPYSLNQMFAHATPGEVAGFPGDTFAYVSFYFTDNAADDDDQSLPRDIDMWSPSTHSVRWSYPWTVMAVLSTHDDD